MEQFELGKIKYKQQRRILFPYCKMKSYVKHKMTEFGPRGGKWRPLPNILQLEKAHQSGDFDPEVTKKISVECNVGFDG